MFWLTKKINKLVCIWTIVARFSMKTSENTERCILLILILNTHKFANFPKIWNFLQPSRAVPFRISVGWLCFIQTPSSGLKVSPKSGQLQYAELAASSASPTASEFPSVARTHLHTFRLPSTALRSCTRQGLLLMQCPAFWSFLVSPARPGHYTRPPKFLKKLTWPLNPWKK